MKQFISLILCFAMVFSFFTVASFGTFAKETSESVNEIMSAGADNNANSGNTGDCTWTLDGTVLTISGEGEMEGYMGYDQPWGSDITKVIIESGVTCIGEFAFSGYTELTEVSISNSVRYIETDAFSGCTGLTGITIPYSVSYIGDNAFSCCTGLQSIIVDYRNTSFDSRNECNAIINTYSDELVCGCINTVIPDSVKGIGDYAFYECIGLKEIDIPDSVTSIGRCAFYRCTGLEKVNLSDSLVTVGASAFEECNALTSINIPSSVTDIGDKAFGYYCDPEMYTVEKSDNFIIYGVTGSAAEKYADSNQIIFTDVSEEYEDPEKDDPATPDEVSSGTTGECSWTLKNSDLTISGGEYMSGYMGDDLPWGYGITGLTIRSGVKNIGEYAFVSCRQLKEVNISNSVTGIESGAFAGCTSLTDVTVPDSVCSIEYDAFSGCTGIKNVHLGNNVISIGEDAFEECTSLESITIPDSVNEIGDHAFGYFYNYDIDDYEKVEDFVIYGNTGTDAEKYAQENGFRFISSSDSEMISGDADGDGKVTTSDVTRISIYLAKIETGTFNEKAADVNNDGNVNVTDATYIQQYLAMMDVTLGIGEKI